ncbi:MaoC family dehydratase N-terminal domain-containing protein [Pseudonocardia sp. KRD-184]|uniref:MaoC family dehydratase N-terminal domain-containing protein n=1 Tax=Pseudonocardia oceani TaxID=2792013 RepID=A0ABS6U748_9PSEU|nr:MaoC family dehydratase N-terminal domain-containing protein [Pseudonocardia oceani]MBW0091551.1 MaoC family dehydratase N-terminal domain-containing protein [Pseudonocardia oceani]MBW0098636.1 MaoC family dehydratase N-terminal domain-containing protein [Pseudonocardia oceani]MBW0111156.1 MaoC family dehydratase N-terminal domain-containing protein [Pseudonocardia oceani]MBW0124936.1 MaoC family dehydratase N-terminal domain-containing protein [Pseudonocardia oceani]MBW0128030.1 MaoC famil
MPDASFVGTALAPSAPYLVGREKIREFALAIGEGASVCTDLDAATAAGHPDLVAPPTFAVTFTMPLIEGFLRDPAFGWDYSRMVHGDQTIVLHRPIHGGDELVTTIHVEDLSSRAGSHMLTLRCEIADAAGAAVATTKALLVTQGEAS